MLYRVPATLQHIIVEPEDPGKFIQHEGHFVVVDHAHGHFLSPGETRGIEPTDLEQFFTTRSHHIENRVLRLPTVSQDQPACHTFILKPGGILKIAPDPASGRIGMETKEMPLPVKSNLNRCNRVIQRQELNGLDVIGRIGTVLLESGNQRVRRQHVEDIVPVMVAGVDTLLGGLGEVFDGIFTGSNLGDHLALAGEEIADSFTGFKVMTHSYLFQLIWNDSISNIFYTKYYTETPNPERVRAFLNDNSLFKVKYLSAESSVYEKTQKKGKYSRTGLLEMITRRSIDRNIAELQSKNEPFKIKTPIMGIEYNAKGKLLGYRALVGQKEGVKEGLKYEVLETVINAKGKVTYNRIATIKPVNNQIWDNRFNALMENNVDGIEGTLFTLVGTATKAIQPGMLIREQKTN